MVDNELYGKLVCALTHSMQVCDECKKCGKDGVEARMVLVEQLADYMDCPIPWNNNTIENDW